MKKYLLLLILFVSIPAFSQSINDYQYVVVPIKFDIFKENDKYRLNTLTKLLLQKYNFKSYLNTETLPDDVANNRCALLYASLVEDNGFLITKVKVVLKDCQEKVIYETDFGTSREKEYALAYNQALRAAFQSFDKLKYKYNGKSDVPEPPVPSVKEVVAAKDLIYGERETAVNNTQNSNTLTSENREVFYFAQPVATGFQVVDSTPKVIMRLFTTSQKNVFIALKGTTNGVVIPKNDQWSFEYYENGKLVSELLKLKF